MRKIAEAYAHLFETVQAWPQQAEQTMPIAAEHERKARTARLAISWGRVRLIAPNHQEQKRAPLSIWVIHVREREAPAGVTPLEWVLLTSVPTTTVEDAWERVGWYRLRWTVEDYHQGLKTGCRLEQRQMQSYEGLRRLLGLHCSLGGAPLTTALVCSSKP